MKTTLKTLIGLSLVITLGNAHAATITYQKRDITTRDSRNRVYVDKADYKASWANQTSAITTQILPDFNNRLGGENTFSRLAINFTTDQFNKVDFELAVDAGFGGAVYFDNVLQKRDTSDLWWDFNWNDKRELLSFTAKKLSIGNHFLEVFWAEGCCNGPNSGRFRVNGGGGWQTLDLANLKQLEPVPVPAAVWLFGSGLVGLVGFGKKKRA